MKKKAKDTTLEQDIDSRIKELEMRQMSRAQAIEPTLSHLEKVLTKAAPSLRIRTAKDFSSISNAHATLSDTQRRCAGMTTERIEHSGTVNINFNERLESAKRRASEAIKSGTNADERA